MPTTPENSFQKIFDDLIWPGIAGSVLWALFTFSISFDHVTTIYFARLGSLILMTIFLCLSWLFKNIDNERQPSNCYSFDIAFASGIAIFSIATGDPEHKMFLLSSMALFTTLLSASIANYKGKVWPSGKGTLLCRIDGIGAGFLFFITMIIRCNHFQPNYYIYTNTAIAFFVILFWILAKKKWKARLLG